VLLRATDLLDTQCFQLMRNRNHIEEFSRITGIKNVRVQWRQHRFAAILFVFALLVAFPYRKALVIERTPKPGEIAKHTVTAPFNIDISKPDSLFQRDIRAAESSIAPVFKKDRHSVRQVSESLDTLLQLIKTVATISPEDSIHYTATEKLETTFSPEEIAAVKKNIPLFESFCDTIKTSLHRGLLSHVPIENLGEIELYREKYDGQFRHVITSSLSVTAISISGDTTIHKSSLQTIPDLYHTLFEMIDENSPHHATLTSVLYTLFDNNVRPTLLYDGNEMSKRRELARNNVKSILRTVPRNVEIVRKHQIVTPSIVENLNALQEQYHQRYASSITLKSIISQCTTLMLLMGLTFILIRSLRGLVPRGVSKVTFFKTLSLIMAVSFVIIRIGAIVMKSVAPEVLSNSSAIVYTAVPMVIGSLMAAALFNKETGFIISVFFSVYGSILGGYDPIIPLGVLISGGIVSGLAASLRYRRDFLSMVVWIAVTNILIGITMILIDGTNPTMALFAKTLLFSVANAVATVAFSFLLLPLFEQLFHLTTDMTLMELADMNHPLLKRLAIEAPGTYNHSIMVANLAEAAAESIGADGLLCRVVSYYHDIGKLKKPHNFIENQYSKRNIHDKISPSMSVRIIAGHVREGLELAEEYRLPQAIKDVIPQHHGDGPISFFYHKAMEEKADGVELDIRDFSYGGPKPQTRENAVVMIADSVEAASRMMKSTSLKDVRESVKKIIWSKVAQNQFDECGLTLSDLSEITNGMMPILEGVFHSRIEYPEEEEREDG